MDNLKFFDFLVVGRHAFCVGLCALALAAHGASAEERIQPAAPSASAGQAEESQATAAVQKIQRLLKLLATRYPERYGIVDPGRVDGVLGGETKIALRNFRAIAGLTKDPRPDSQLTPEILSELASMSVNDGSDSVRSVAGTPAGDVDLESTKASTDASVKPSDAKPVGQTPRTVPRRETPAPGPSVAEAAKPIDSKLYFVQVASLRSLIGANREWDRIKEANRAALQGEQVYFERANIKERGVFYRILIGPQPNREDANTLCSFLKQNDQTCVVALRSPAEIRRNAELKDDDSRQGPAVADEESPVDSPPPAASAKGGATADPAAPSADRSPAPEPATARNTRSPAPPAKSATPGGEPPAPPTNPGATAPEPADPPSGLKSQAAISNERGPPRVPMPPVTADKSAASAKPSPAEEASTAIEADPTPVRQPEPLQRNEPKNGPAAVAAPDLQNQAAPSDAAARRAEAPGDAPQSQTNLASAALAAGRRFAEGWQNRTTAAVLAVLIICGGLLYIAYRRHRRAANSKAVLASGLTLADLNEGQSEAGQTIARLEEDFESQQLREARLVRDDFLRHILGGNPENAFALENSDSAIRVNSSLKELLATDPARYKSIFLNLIFLSTLGASLDRKEITPDQLNDQFGRELGLLRSCFKIHLLELDDRHRIRKELPGLFYCLQVSELLKRPKKLHFTAA